MANKTIDIVRLKEQSKEWKSVLIDNLSQEEKDIYLKRKRAVDMYLDGHILKDINKDTGLAMGEPRRLVDKCCALDKDNQPIGYVALLPYKRIKEYNRKYDTGYGEKQYSGMFSRLLNRYPELDEYIKDLYCGRDRTVLEKNISIKTIHRKFLNMCIKLGIRENEYPFNTIYLAKKSLSDYICRFNVTEYKESSIRYGQDTRRKLLSQVTNKGKYPSSIRPYSRIEVDGHKIDCILTIKIRTAEGDYITKTISRIWLLTAIDVATRSILGYHLTINEEYNRFDLLQCIENAIKPHEFRKFTIEGFEYPDNGGYPSIAVAETNWAVFDEILLDNAMSHLAKDTIDQLVDTLGCSVNFGPVKTPERRPIIERFFQTLETMGYHRLVSTTGTGINDVRRTNAERDAVKFEIEFDEIEQLTEVLIAQYNNTAHSSLNGFTPLEILQQRLERGLIPSKIPINKRQEFTLLTLIEIRTIRGNQSTGKQPHITFKGVAYRSDTLSKSFWLIRKTLTLVINPNDLRTIKSYFEDGSEFCILQASGKWKYTKHSLKERNEINQFINHNKIKVSEYDDPIDAYHNYLLKKSENNKSSRNKLASLEKNIFESSDNNHSKTKDEKLS